MTDQVIADLGALDGPLLVFGGVYSNLEAFEALIDTARAERIPPAHMLHTGDVVAYCADAAACNARLRELGCLAIRGNVEQQLGQGAGDCGCGFEEGSECDALSARWYAHAMREMTPGLCRWMAAMPDQLRFTLGGVHVHVIHGGVRDVSRFMFGSLSEEAFEAELAASGADCVIAGHTGIPFTRRIGGRLWHNSGAVGMPANDGTPRGWYSLVEPQGGGLSIEIRPLHYDAATAAAKIRAAGLPEGYAASLATGLWPNTYHLPAVEKEATGKPLAPELKLWAPVRAAAAE